MKETVLNLVHDEALEKCTPLLQSLNSYKVYFFVTEFIEFVKRLEIVCIQNYLV